LIAIAVIFAGCSAAWFALGASVVTRTGEYDRHLRQDVALLWGDVHAQRAPEAAVARVREGTETVVETRDGKVFAREVKSTVTDWPAARLVSTSANVTLDLEHRQKGLLW
jgi:hypothetical protein